MSSAADIVRMQADLLDAFHLPDPRSPNLAHVANTASGQRIEFPVSVVGKIVDHLMFGPNGSAGREVRPLFVSLDRRAVEEGWAPPYSCAAIVGNGLAHARAYRVQENMTDAVLRRADALPADTRFGLNEDEITPPRSAGFAYFCEPVTHLSRPARGTGSLGDPGIGLITWTAVVDMDDADQPRELAWMVVVWDDVCRTRVFGEMGRKLHDAVDDGRPRGKQRFVPVTAFAVTPGHLLGGALLPIKQFGEQQLRSPLQTVGALWSLLGETVPSTSGDHIERVAHSTEATDKRTRRQARAAGIDGEPEVTTVVLRRESKPVQNPGTGHKPTSRVEIEEYTAWRWVGSEARGDRRRVRRPIRKHWSSRDTSLPIRERTVVSELKR